MDVNSNKYTIGFSIVMVVIVALLLAFASEGLKPMQNQNIEREKMQNILKSVGVEVTRDEAKDAFDKYITEQIVLNDKGEQIEGDAFKVDVLKEYKSGGQKNFPIFIYENEGSKKYIIPLVGKGLWGPIWGYIALEEDKNTVAGATFDHKGETPGLGAEINQGWFQDPFVGKKVFDESGEYQSIKVVKGGATEGNKHAVDAISGGTITGNGVTEMLVRTLKIYEPYLKS
ncbi:MAG TPA: NADH:ubiquinone reductase (Na(+)-transporting) subunit C [Vicingaceae bacterium]|nr:NADH:ubiquinone reductase (Na(+)-transporting) subunit C [Vicingaceae bacterium]